MKYLALAGLFYNLYLSAVAKTSRKEPSKPRRTKTSPTFTERQKKLTLLAAFNAFWWSAHGRFSNPVLPHPLREPYTHPTYPLKILSAEESVTGLITVAEWLPPSNRATRGDEILHSARYLRASHSILGGVWMYDKIRVFEGEEPVRDAVGTPLGDSIYSTFVLQEAVRMINSTQIGARDAWDNGLIM